ncbi:MAG: hypothetical protein KKB31_01425 [Nanoarchaeota archaeon]|nr:hypothetical protein [Nanoarchaeota archaeon]
MERISNFYRWYDEPNFISIKIDDNYLKSLIDRCIKKAKTIENLSKITKISKASIHNYKNRSGMNIKNIKIILDFLNIKYDRINQYIEKIGWNNTNPEIYLGSDEIAIILAASLADGHLNQSHFMYKNKNEELINRIKKCVKKVFGDVNISERIDKNGTPYILCPSFVKRQLERLGSPRGKKLFHNPFVPKVIKQGTKSQKKLFIQHFFDDEGWPEVENRRVACCQAADTIDVLPKEFVNRLTLGKSYSVNKIPLILKSKIIKPNLLIDIQDLLISNFGIHTNLNLKRIIRRNWKNKGDYVSAIWELQCMRKKDVQKFKEKINFFSSNKKNILEDITNEQSIPKDILLKLLNLSIKLKKEKGFFRVKDMQDYLDLERGKIRKRLNTLVKHKILYNNGGTYFLKLDI